MTTRCSSCNRKLLEYVETRAIVRCRCGTVNILRGDFVLPSEGPVYFSTGNGVLRVDTASAKAIG